MKKSILFLFVLKIDFLYGLSNITLLFESHEYCVPRGTWKVSICVPITQCKYAITTRNKLQICEWKEKIPNVCCDGKDSERLDIISKNSSMESYPSIGNKTIAEVMCKRYEDLVYPYPKYKEGESGIVLGANADPGEFPHMALIGWTDYQTNTTEWNCGGSIISNNFILTAAHCSSNKGLAPDVIRVGEYDLRSDDNEAHLKEVNVKRIIKHPDYVRSSKYHDIALIELNGYIKFKRDLRPACLNIVDTVSETTVIATGWGRVDFDGIKASILQKVVLQYFTNSECNMYYHRSRKLKEGIQEKQTCYGDRVGNKDTCQGDSGGPIQIRSKLYDAYVYKIVGVTSFGNVCGSGTPGVYTRVASYVPWIESIVWPAN